MTDEVCEFLENDTCFGINIKNLKINIDNLRNENKFCTVTTNTVLLKSSICGFSLKTNKNLVIYLNSGIEFNLGEVIGFGFETVNRRNFQNVDYINNTKYDGYLKIIETEVGKKMLAELVSCLTKLLKTGNANQDGLLDMLFS